METNSKALGALWVNQPKSENSPVLTGEINGQRVVVFKNKKWSTREQVKQPLYFIRSFVAQGKQKTTE